MFTGWNKLWFFYIILAVGLVLAAKMMGKNSTQRIGDAKLATRLLLPELDCHIKQQPCAAMFNDGALIARLYEVDDRALLRIRQSGMTEQQQKQAKTVVSVQGAVIQGQYQQKDNGAYWFFSLPQSFYKDAVSLKVTVVSEERWLTDFEL